MLASIDWADAISRWHPVLLHLPIGILVALAWMRLFRSHKPEVERSLLKLLMISVFLTALTGWLLHEEGSYGHPVEWHEWLGISVLGMCLYLAWVHRYRQRWFGWILAATVMLLIPTADLGGQLTHGEDFLWQPFQSQSPANETAGPTGAFMGDQVAEGSGKSASNDLAAHPHVDRFQAIAPLLTEYCTRCHGAKKHKGELRLHTFADLQAGGESGPAWAPGAPELSEILLRMRLPLEDEDHMPPKNKTQPSEREIAALEAWIEGASIELKTNAQNNDLDADLVSARVPVDTQAANSLIEHGAVISATEFGSSAIHIDWICASSLTREQLPAIDRLGHNIVGLSFVGQTLPKDWLADIAKLPRLESLDLSRVTNAPLDLSPLLDSPSLRFLRAAQVHLTMDGILAISKMPSLERLVISSDWIDQKDRTALPQRPGLEIISGWKEAAQVLEQESEVSFEPYVEPQSSNSPPAADLDPVNLACPLTGKPIQPNYRLVFEERVIGFCCADCVATFLEDPASYRESLPANPQGD